MYTYVHIVVKRQKRSKNANLLKSQNLSVAAKKEMNVRIGNRVPPRGGDKTIGANEAVISFNPEATPTVCESQIRSHQQPATIEGGFSLNASQHPARRRQLAKHHSRDAEHAVGPLLFATVPASGLNNSGERGRRKHTILNTPDSCRTSKRRPPQVPAHRPAYDAGER